MSVRFEVFGGVRAVGDDGAIALRPQVAQLLGVLLAEPRTPVPVDRVVDRMWRGDPPATAPKIVHIAVGRLRAALESAEPGAGAVLRTVTSGYVLAAGPADLDEYEDACQRAVLLGARQPEAALAALEVALPLWKGRPWGDGADAEFLRDRVGALEEQHRDLEETWADLMLECGRAGEALEVLRAATSAEPLRERRWAQLMTGLYRSGRQVEALREYERVRRVLRDELGIEPGPELRRLELAILHQDPMLLRASPTRTEVYASTSFVGREQELASLARAVDRQRIVTVTGIGGIGKTRLVSEFAHRRRLAGESVRTVSFSSLEVPARFEDHAARQLGLFVDEGGPLTPVLAAAVGDEPALLIVDAAERVVNEVGHLVLTLVELCPRARVVITSRVPLGLGAEREIRIGRLPDAPADGTIAGTDLELMLDRAGFDAEALDAVTLDALREACRATAGIPLLIELAARRANWDADAVVESHAGEPVAAAIAHSLDAVDPVARALVRRGAVLPGGMTEATATHIGGLAAADESRRALRQLAWMHLVDAFPGTRTVRYRSLDPIRSALLDDLADSERDDALGRATAAVQELVDRIWPDHVQPIVLTAVDAVADEHDNLRFLLADRIRHAPPAGLELAIGASDYWAVRGHVVEGREWLTAAIDAAQPVGPPRWRAALALVRATRTMPETAQLRELLESVAAEAREDPAYRVIFGGLLIYLAIARAWQGDRVLAAQALDEATRLDQTIGSEWTRAHLQHLRALDAALTGNFARAREGQLAFAARMLELGDPAGAATGRYLAASIGDMMGMDAVLADVRTDLAAARELAEQVGDMSLLSRILLLEARVLQKSNDAGGRALLLDAVDRLTEQGGIGAAALARRDVGLLALRDGAPAEADEHLRVVAPLLLRLDRSASAPAWAGLAQLAATRGETDAAATLARAARCLAQPDAPHRVEDERWVEELLAPLALPPGPDAVTDDELLALVAG